MSDGGLNDLAKALEQDRKRELDQKHKWYFGESSKTAGHPSRRPEKPNTPSYSRRVRRELELQQNKATQTANISRKHESRIDTDISNSDSSAEEDIKDASAAPEPESAYTYSFDAARGPGKGSQILGMALAKAVEKYEHKATDKLIKEEYEVVGDEKEDMHPGYAADVDGFELV